ncbi:MAG TPA: styrene monooxygenase/indole monooxygenase family protein [Archangium sp.]|jgi:2-polyprenyl-6-methoxyphenol hydroxylase-like FAD-dependent oxidoreductase|uniref:styrene monooxygenase/indole monooxygenase family protein n=1 Tax=Archangium sp. TaxID=1872627 RepID=UPI002ED8B455
MASIGIIGAGTAGLHLGLKLLANGVPVTIYAERDPELLRSGRLPGNVAHHAPTRARERSLAVNHWDSHDFGMFQVSVNVGGPQPFGFRGYMDDPSLFVDYRLYQPRLLEDFMERGGQLIIDPVDAAGVETLARQHDLVVVATGRSGLTARFPRIPELSPHTRPARRLFAALLRGVRAPRPTGLSYSISPGHGEIFEAQMITPHGQMPCFLAEAIPGGALEPLATRKYEEDPRGFDTLLLELVREHAPETYSRVEPAEFGVLGPLDYVQGGFTPVVRRGYAALGEGRFLLALGDTHVTNDPISGQGANAASGAAFALADVILDALAGGFDFDEDFCERAEKSTWAETRAITDWTNAMLQPPPPHLHEVLVAASEDPNLADVVVNTLLTPERAVATFASPESASAFRARHSQAARLKRSAS